MSNGVISLQRPYISFSSTLLLILKWEITAVAVALFYLFLCSYSNQYMACLYGDIVIYCFGPLKLASKTIIK